MSIPNLPNGRKIADGDGNINDEWLQFFQQLIIALQQVISDEGILLPGQDSTNVDSLNTDKSIRKILFNTTDNVAQVNLTGTFVTIQTS